MASQVNLDRLCLQIFGNDKVYFECGGAHPSEQNNTEILENFGWSGIVVEPWTGYNDLYKKSRQNTILENFALVSNSFVGEFVEGTISFDFGGSLIKGAHGNPWNPSLYPVSTVTKLLQKHSINEVHFMTVDVEGYEIEVLNGIDFDKFKIHMLVPEYHWGEDFDFLENYGFKKIKILNNQHIFFNVKSEYLQTAENLLTSL